MASLKAVQAALQEAVLGAVSGINVGTRQTITIGGTPTVGDTVTLTLACPAFVPFQLVNVSYVVAAGDLLFNVAQQLARALANNSVLQNAGVRSFASTSIPQIYVFAPTYPSPIQIAWSSSTSTGATETISFSSTPVVPQVAIGWPPIGALQDLARGGCLISIYDLKRGRDVTRWNPYPYNQFVITPILTQTPTTPQMIPVSGSASVTLGTTSGPTVANGDAVAAVVTNPTISLPYGAVAGVVAAGISGDTPSSMAGRLITAIAEDPVVSTWISASQSGPVLTFTNLLEVPLSIQVNVGNNGGQTRELNRRERGFQIVIWSRTENEREAIIEPIAQMLALQEVNFGPVLADGTNLRLLYVNDLDIEDATLEDVYRHDFLVTIDYPVTVQDLLYSVLVPVPAFQTF